jgi:hypothetical protein
MAKAKSRQTKSGKASKVPDGKESAAGKSRAKSRSIKTQKAKKGEKVKVAKKGEKVKVAKKGEKVAVKTTAPKEKKSPSKSGKSPKPASTRTTTARASRIRSKKIERPPPVNFLELSLEDRLKLTKGTTARAIISAQIAVEAIASEKTAETRAAQQEADDDEKDPEAIADKYRSARRSKKDPFESFRTGVSLHRPDDPFSEWRQQHLRARHEFGQGHDPDDLYSAEGRLKVVFPPSYWDFCLEWGSGLIFTSPWREIRFISAADLVHETKDVLKGSLMKPFLPIVCLGLNDYLVLNSAEFNKQGECPVCWWSVGSDRPQRIAGSFVEWLNRAESTHGDHYWLEE